jgi:hypothetical protein
VIVSIQQALNCLALFITMCTSNYHNIKQCLPVWEYIPAYYLDYKDFKDNTIYYRERELLNEI